MKFFKTFLASLLGTILGILLLILIIFATIVSSSSEAEPYIRSNTVLTMSITGDIPVRAPDDPFEELFNPGAGERLSLESLRTNLRKAAADDNISAVWVRTNMVSASWANLERARGYFEEYKESGKPLYFSTDDLGMNEKSYFLATKADSIFSPIETNFQFDGFVASFSFYRGLLDKIGIEPEIIRVGKYKSAVEPFMNNSPSPESVEQTQGILDTVTNTFINAVMERTGKSYDEVSALMDTPPVDRVNFALENGLIDVIAFPDEVEDIIKQRLEVDEDTDLRTVNFRRYSRVSPRSAGVDVPSTDNKIAVIYTSGQILPNIPDSPFGTGTGITASSVKRQLDAAIENDAKAIVIHINSPGGAATTSDMLMHYIQRASEKVPVVASMGSVAASGGYYMAMGADTVMAAPNTITGSIGIFSLLFNTEELYNENLGITFETLKTHEYADLYNLTRPFTVSERNVIEQNMENGYETFLQRVADARGMSRDEVHEVAQGRVFTGQAAYEAGLVDIVGDLDRAIEVAAEMAELEEYLLDTYPKRKDLFETLFSSANTQMRAMLTSWIPAEMRSEADDLHAILQQPIGQNWALLPIRIDVD
ncbi:MAG: signal peptide peptidase SppA [Balneolaceae bacterium]|nr:signal peptide peptidase SppA [Balneolaceae bacterium]MCH8549565.1 signal peptide peptidase SppA [Balneolaceae bacterium]